MNPAAAPAVHIIGTYISPFVRKVLAALHLKKIPYSIDPIVGFYGDERFSRLSPLRRIPVLVDPQVTLCDSSVICQYLEDRYPQPALYPADIADRARARWLEEYADTRLCDVLIWQLFAQLAVRPRVFNVPTDEPVVERTLNVDIPQVMDYLETQLPADGFACGPLSIADLSLAAPFRNAGFVRWRPDPLRWPKTAAYVERVFAEPCFAALKPYEDVMRRLPVLEQRQALLAAGAPLSTETYGTDTPRLSFRAL